MIVSKMIMKVLMTVEIIKGHVTELMTVTIWFSAE